MKQSVGVTPFKTIIRLCYPRAVAQFDSCAREHDKSYHSIDWARDDPTETIDAVLLYCMLNKAGDDPGLVSDAWLFHSVARRWAKLRKFLWRLGIRY